VSPKSRATRTERDVVAGCYRCPAAWKGGSAQGSAAHHHDQTDHATWVRVEMVVRYGADAPDLLPVEAPRLGARPSPRRRRRRHFEAR
jgi:hypothetical protein